MDTFEEKYFYKRSPPNVPSRFRTLDQQAFPIGPVLAAFSGGMNFVHARQTQLIMFRNYWLVAWRNILRNKTFSTINILGLSIGMAACFMIFQYVRVESGYDSFHVNSDRLYRVPISYSGSFSSVPPTATNHPALGPALKSDFPEVEDFARMTGPSFLRTIQVANLNHRGGPLSFVEKKAYFADASFLNIFSFPMVSGNVAQALNDPKSVVITESIARKYFGNEPALGKELTMNRSLNLRVTGVLKDLPHDSHLQFEILISFTTMGEKWGYETWAYPEFYNYILLKKGADPKALEKKFPAFIEKYLGEIQRKNNFQSHFSLQPVTDIHLKSHLLLEQSTNSDERTVRFLSWLAIFILLVAGINYINLSTAKSLERSKEVGLRKVVGAHRRQLITQFFFDAFLINVLSALTAGVLIEIGSQPFEHFLGFTFSGGMFDLGQSGFRQWTKILLTFLGTILFIGAYPAILLSSFNPALVLKGKFYKSGFGIRLRQTMVAFQYILAILLVAVSITIYKQLDFMRTENLGYQKDQLLVVKGPSVADSTILERSHAFKNMLAKLSPVQAVAVSTDIPGKEVEGRNQVWTSHQTAADGSVTYEMGIDQDFVNTYGIKLAAGRNFTEQDNILTFEESEKTPIKVMVNELLRAQLGYPDPQSAIGEKIIVRLGDHNCMGEIVGVTQNHHQVSLRENFEPILYYFPAYGWDYFSINFDPKEIDGLVSSIRTKYDEAFPDNTFDFFFLDDHFDQQYRSDERFGTLFSVFTAFAILVAALGLTGLSIFTVSHRTKEVGIRKVLGASSPLILLLFSRDFLKVLSISYLLVVPVIYFSATTWLENFSFRAPLSWEAFVAPPLVLLTITLTTILAISLKAALASPVHALRQE